MTSADTFSAERLLAHRFPEIRHAYVERDAILYALGIGLGADPVDPVDLACLYEAGMQVDVGMQVLPTLAVTLSSPGMWVKEPALGINWTKLLHVAQSARFETPLPPKGEVVGRARVASLVDRGADRGAELVLERTISDAVSGQVYCVLEQTLLMRGNGGFAAQPAPRPPRIVAPERPPDHVLSFQTSPRAALIYRLSGDWNPLHIDPEIARSAGFDRPILNGLASYGIAGWVVLKALGQGKAEQLKALSLRFTSPVIPGKKLDFDLWTDGSSVNFIARSAGRIVIDQGRAELA
jgi:acyl dehydratase